MRLFKTILASVFIFSNLLVFQNCAEGIDVNEYTNQASLAGTAGADDSLPVPPIVAPTITSQSPSPSITAGQAFSLSVNVQGDAPSLQWYKNSVAISGAVTASYSVAAASLADAGNYKLIASNMSGQAAADFVVTVTTAPPVIPPPAPPVITSQPTPVSTRTIMNARARAWIPATVVFSVAATGSNLTYQWYRRGAVVGSVVPNEIAIPGATGASYPVKAVYGDAMANFCGVYRVVVTNGAGSVSSSSVIVECYSNGKSYK